jgi:hypothetical protein
MTAGASSTSARVPISMRPRAASHDPYHGAAPRLASRRCGAARRGIEDGGLAQIESLHGRAVLPVSIDAAMRPRNAFGLSPPTKSIKNATDGIRIAELPSFSTVSTISSNSFGNGFCSAIASSKEPVTTGDKSERVPFNE